MDNRSGPSWRDIPRGVWVLGFVSLLMDTSSEMIHALLPIYLVSALGASMATVGVIEGLAEAAAMFTKVFSGVLSDWLGRRKLLAAIGYGLAALTKPVFPLATTLGVFVGARVVDRIGKGIRGAPRDALVADLTPEHVRGASFGLRQSLDTTGAVAGPAIAIGLMFLTLNDVRIVFWCAVVPAFAATALIVFGVDEPATPTAAPNGSRRWRLADVSRLSGAFWTVVALGFVFTLARFSEAFLVLRARSAGLPLVFAPAVLVVMNAVYAFVSYPAGALSDRIGRWRLLLAGAATLILADLVLAYGVEVWTVMLGIALWGGHLGLTQGLLSTLVADTATDDLRGTAFGLFNLASGVAVLVASVVAGRLWDTGGPRLTFLAGAAFTAVAMTGALWVRVRRAA